MTVTVATPAAVAGGISTAIPDPLDDAKSICVIPEPITVPSDLIPMVAVS